jgi:hypothetical protein
MNLRARLRKLEAVRGAADDPNRPCQCVAWRPGLVLVLGDDPAPPDRCPHCGGVTCYPVRLIEEVVDWADLGKQKPARVGT